MSVGDVILGLFLITYGKLEHVFDGPVDDLQNISMTHLEDWRVVANPTVASLELFSYYSRTSIDSRALVCDGFFQAKRVRLQFQHEHDLCTLRDWSQDVSRGHTSTKKGRKQLAAGLQKIYRNENKV